MKKLALVSPYPLIAAGLHAILPRELRLSFHAPDMGKLLDLTTVLLRGIDLIIADVRLPRVAHLNDSGDGTKIPNLLLARRLRIPVLHMSAVTDKMVLERCQMLGSKGFLPQTVDRDMLVKAIEKILRGYSLWQDGNFHPRKFPHDGGIRPLTAREEEVLRCLRCALSNKEIARSLGISVETVKEHVQNVLHKLNLGDRTQAAVWSMEHRNDAA